MTDLLVDCKDYIYKIRKKRLFTLNDIESKQMDPIAGFPSPYGATTYISEQECITVQDSWSGRLLTRRFGTPLLLPEIPQNDQRLILRCTEYKEIRPRPFVPRTPST